ncbi:MAG: LacI family DNA-binding transcriptional regulator [Candidatus Dormibacteria bacterium]
MGHSGRAATIYDLARVAGVSPSTVSRALRGRGQVSSATVRRVREAAASLKYRPNAVARSLTARQSASIAVLLPDIANPFFPALVREVQLRAHGYGQSVLLCNTGADPEAEVEYLEMLASQQIQGVVAMGLTASPARVRRYLKAGMRMVTLDRSSSLREIVSVQADHRLGGDLVTTHLIGIGHRRIAHISGPLKVSVAAERGEGYVNALSREGLTPSPGLEVAGAFTEASGYQAAVELLSHGLEFTALVVGNDLMALGAMAALRQAGLRIPQDVSVVGFDDIEMGQYTVPALTTVRQPLALMAAAAVDILAERSAAAAPASIRIPVELVVRSSTAAPGGDPERSGWAQMLNVGGQ